MWRELRGSIRMRGESVELRALFPTRNRERPALLLSDWLGSPTGVKFKPMTVRETARSESTSQSAFRRGGSFSNTSGGSSRCRSAVIDHRSGVILIQPVGALETKGLHVADKKKKVDTSMDQ